jgi:hypothetical protein
MVISRFARAGVPVLVPLLVLGVLLAIVYRTDTNAVDAATGRGRLDTVVVEQAVVPKTLRATLISAGQRAATLRTAPGTAGIVTAVSIETGSILRSGSPVFELDGRSVLAAATERPFHRPIGPGASGPDVEMLGRLLARLGLIDEAAVGSRAEWELVVGIDHLWRRLSGEPGPNYVFEPSWLVWIPRDDVVVTELALEVGMPAPAMFGSVVGAHSEGRVVLDDGSELPRDRWGEYRVQRVDGVAARGSAPLLEEVVADPGRFLGASMSGGAVGVGSTSGAEPSGAGRDEAASGGGQRSFQVVLSVAEDVEGAVVPLTALLGISGRQCVVVVNGSTHEIRDVVVLGESNGRPVVDGVASGSRIIAAPDPRAFRCPG